MSAQATRTRPTTFEAVAALSSRMSSPEGVAKALAFRPQSSDVIITPYGKCGTTWIQQVFHSLRTRGDMDFDDISRVVPWIETAHELGLDLDAPQRGEPRGFKSHFSYDLVPKGARYIVSIRDPKDALVSSFRFMEGWWFETGSVPIETFARVAYMRRGSKRDYWHHLLSWWEQRNNPNVLMLCYEHMNRDLAGSIRRIAAFAGIALDDELFDIAMRHASLEFMLAHKNRFDDFLMRQRSETVGGLPTGSDSSKVRKGKVGEHTTELPPEISAQMDDIWRQEIEAKLGFSNYAALTDALAREQLI